MKKLYLLIVFLFCAFITTINAQIAAWDFTGASSPTTWAAITFDPNLVSTSGADNVTRGAGAAASSGANSFRTTGFQNNGISTSNTDYFQITITAKTGYSVSLSTIDANFNGTSTFAASPGVTYQYAYSLDGTTFTLIGSPASVIGAPVSMPQIDLSGISALQNVPSTTTITIRYYASGQTITGGWGFYSASSGTNGLAIGGSVDIAPTIYTWDGSFSCAWLVVDNWTPNTNYPGNMLGNNDVARFGAAIAANTGIGINMNTLGGNLELGGIEIANTYLGSNFNIGNNSGITSGTLKLNGTRLNAVNNTVIRNASAYNVSINDKSTGGSCTNTGPVTMGVLLNNTTNNIVSVEGTGSVIINSIISGSNPLEKIGSGAGKLTLNAANTLSGNVTVSAGTLQLSNNPTLASVNTITVKAGGTLQITASQTLTNIILESGATLTVDATRTLTISGTLTVNVGATISTTGTIAYDAAAALVYNGTGTKTAGIEWPTTVPRVTIDNNAILKVNSNRPVPGTLFLINGILDAETYSFSGTSTTFTINGTVKTANLNGLINSGASGTTFTGYTNGPAFSTAVLGATSTIDYNATSGNQNITGAVDYVNLIASGGGTKIPSTGTDVSGTLSVLDNGTILDGSTYSLGGNTTSLVMTGTSYYKVNGAGTKPDAGGTSYTLSANSTIEFTGTSATLIRVSSPTPSYGNIIVSGSNVSLSSDLASIKMQTGTSFTVTSTGTFNVQSSTGFTDAAGAAVSSTNNPTIDLQNGSTINYNGIAQPLTPRNDYRNLTISGSGAKTAASAFNVAETFTRSGDASLATTSPTYGAGATLAYVDATAGRIYNAGLEWPTADVPTNLTVNLSGTGTRQVILPGDRTVAGTITLSAGELSINGNTLTANGAFSYGTGTITGSSTSNLVLNGTAGTVNFTQTSAATRSLSTLNMGDTSSATLGNALDVYDAINFTAGGNLNLNAKNLTLKSNATNTARISDLTGSTLSGASNVTVERWIPQRGGNPLGGRAYRLLAPTVSSTGSIKTNWMEGGQVLALGDSINPVQYYGTHISGGSIANGFDQTQTGQPSLYLTTNGVTPTYYAIPNVASTSLNPYTGYFLFIRGDRSVKLTLYNTNVPPTPVPLPTTSTTLRATGTLQTGTKINTDFTNTPIGGAGALSLITNPYPSALDWSKVYLSCSNIKNTYQLWDPNIGYRGGFIAVNDLGVTSPSGSGSLANKYIQPGQAFFVEASGASVPSISIQESHKAVGNNNGVFFVDPATLQTFALNMYYYEGTGYRRLADGITTVYDASYSAAIDENDASDINNWDENLAIARNGKRLAIESRPLINGKDTIFIFMNNMKLMNYELEFKAANFNTPGLVANLVDNFTQTKTQLSTTGTTVVPITVSSNPASAASDRFMVVFENTAGPLPIDISSIKAYEKNSGIQVDWMMSTEQDMDKYEVEKSTDGRHFVKTGTVLSKGNSNIQVNYGWFDANPAFGDNFYRIRAIEKA
ncbi:MAG: hypothetical protein JST34_07690, partial [Bacteroidetes bacterium]|nr:hypothetical protein [Bacteroidota bacterium]